MAALTVASLDSIGRSRKTGRPDRRESNRKAEYRTVTEEEITAILETLDDEHATVFTALVACGITSQADGYSPWAPFYKVAGAAGMERVTPILRELVSAGHVAELRTAKQPTFIAKVFFTGDMTARARGANVDARTSDIMRRLRSA